MATTGRFGKFAIAFIMVLLIVTGIAGVSHGTGFIVGQYPIALDIDHAEGQGGIQGGESVYVTSNRADSQA